MHRADLVHVVGPDQSVSVMKFGDTLYRRSVPKWAAYNVNYNEIKRLIKQRTSTTGVATPVSIPTASSRHRWSGLEEELFDTIKDQHDNVVLFLKSKYGELDRRLSYLEKQVKSVQRTIDLPYANPALQGRRYHKLLEDTNSIGEDIQNLTRFASVQKTAFRKVLKKYRKWTGSTSLQERLEIELFSSGQLNLDYVHLLERLTVQRRIVTERLHGPRSQDKLDTPENIESSSCNPSSTVVAINSAVEKGPMSFDAAIATVPLAQSSGSTVYWIHPDNVDEAEALLLRHVDEVYKPSNISRQNSVLSMKSEQSRSNSTSSAIGSTHVAYFDSPQRFLHDTSSNRPSKIALSARWCSAAQAVVTMSNLSLRDPSGSTVRLKRKELTSVLTRDTDLAYFGRRASMQASKVRRVQEYMLEHRDVELLAQVRSSRTRYVGVSNSTQAGTWATLDRDVVISDHGDDQLGSIDTDSQHDQPFPHAILEIRWEANHVPEILRAFDATHLAEKVEDFTLESAAVHTIHKELLQPTWKSLLEKDIRKVPVALKVSTNRGSAPRGRSVHTGISSGASSDGPPESVFSSQQIHSSATSDVSPEASTREPLPTAMKSASKVPNRKKKRARIDAESPPPRQSRYWNEFDDGDEDVNGQEAYTIYVDPNESFPGVETVSKAFGAMYQSLHNAKSRVSTMFSLKPPRKSSKKVYPDERTRLLEGPSTSNSDFDADSSDSDTTPTQEISSLSFGAIQSKQSAHARTRVLRSGSASAYRPNQILTPRQEALERTYLQFYSGLLTLAYVLLFVSGVLLFTGRKKALLEVDVAVIAGIVTAEICGVMSLILIWMRKQVLTAAHWGIVTVAFTGIVLIGVAEVVGIIGRAT